MSQPPNPPPPLFVDQVLSCRLERAEGRGGASFVAARAQLSPHVGAIWREMGGAFVMYDGPASPVTQTFALGMSEPVTADLMDDIEDFFLSRGAPVFHEVSPLAHESALQHLTTRGYRPIEFTNVLFRELGSVLGAAAPQAPGVVVRPTLPSDAATWIDTAVEGWSEFSEYAGEMRELSRISVAQRDIQTYLAILHDQPIATGALGIMDGVALLAGASTIPSARKRGAQLALLYARLHSAVAAGCDLAMMSARPGSASQRNAERHGFRIAYTRIKWELRRAQ